MLEDASDVKVGVLEGSSIDAAFVQKHFPQVSSIVTVPASGELSGGPVALFDGLAEGLYDVAFFFDVSLSDYMVYETMHIVGPSVRVENGISFMCHPGVHDKIDRLNTGLQRMMDEQDYIFRRRWDIVSFATHCEGYSVECVSSIKQQSNVYSKGDGKWSAPPCLPLPKRAPIGDGVLRAWSLDWTVANLLTHTAIILLRERLGIQVESVGNGCCSYTAVLAVSGCPYATTPPTLQSGNATTAQDCLDQPLQIEPVAHFAVDAWLHNYEDEYKMLVHDTEPEMQPEAHSLGYNGTEGIFCPNAVGVPAQEVHSYNLYDFVTYDTAKNGFLAKQFFDTYSEVDAFGALWNETAVVDCSTLPYASALSATQYLSATGDSAGFEISDSGTPTMKCDRGWWFAPECRSNAERCIPVITCNGWYF